MKLTTKIDYNFLRYYHYYDFINKYNLKSFYKKSDIKSVILELSLTKIIDSFLLKHQYNIEVVQVVSFLLFYILSNFKPYINFHKSNFIQTNQKNNYALKIIFSNNNSMYSFLHDIHSRLKFKNIKEKKMKINLNGSLIVKEVCNAYHFFELKTFLNKYATNINIKELNLSLYFKFSSKTNITSEQFFVRNFPFLNN